MYKKIFYSLVLKKLSIFTFPHGKMVIKYAEIGRVGKLEIGFQQVSLVQNF